MTDTLLQTKLTIPPTRRSLVPRPHLIEKLNAGLDIKFTLVSAPAGFGKTTLLSRWVRSCERQVTWISLNKGDNDPTRFFLYFIAALQKIQEGIGEEALITLQSPQPSSYEALLTGLINDMTETAEPFVLILDDFHLISEQQIHDALTFLLDNLSPTMHLIISGRSDPPWPLARLRARNEMAELRTHDLRFTSQEAAAFLNDGMNLNLSQEDVAALEARTEGWIAGLQMAALSMRGRTDTSAFISAFTGSHRFILDYLVEEVLEQQSHNVQEFLLKTSILESMTAPLCDAVMEGVDSQTILNQLDWANLFLIPLDDERRWYRYHHLFADLLRSHLAQSYPDQVQTLHSRASEWYEKNGLLAEAVSHGFVTGDIERVADLVEAHALTMVYQGDLATLAAWLDRFPDELMVSRPWLYIAQAWTLVYTGQLDAIEPPLQIANNNLPVDGQRIKGHSAAIRAYAAFLRWDGPCAMGFAREALIYLPEDDLMVRGLVSMVLAIGYHGSGDLKEAGQAIAEAIAASQAAQDLYVAINALCELADIQMTQGQLHKSAATCRDTLQMAGASGREGGKQLPIAGYAFGRLSVVLREWNDVTAAINYAQQCIELSSRWGQADTLILGHSFLTFALLAIGDADGALDVIREAKRIATDVSPRYSDFIAAREARVLLAMGDVAAATRWVRESGLSVDDDPCRPMPRYIFLARVLIAQAQFEEALRLLARLLEMAEVSGAMGHVIGISILQALALQGSGKSDQALKPLEYALSLAEPEGYVRTFIDEGEPVGRLLRQAIAKGIAVAYASRLLAALEVGAETKRQAGAAAQAPMIDPLSERELEVLRLLTTHLSSIAIAQELTISVNTVRTHIKNIYSKLNVHNRNEAVQRARELDII